MKDQVISKYLSDKCSQFLDYFPSAIHKDIVNDAYLTGGAMLNLKQYNGGEVLEDKINDFDIYFKSKPVLLNVVKDIISDYHDDHDSEKHYEKAVKNLSIKFNDIYGNEYSESDYYSDDSDKIFLTLDLPKAFNAMINHSYFRHSLKTKNVSYMTKHSINLGKFQIIMRFVGEPDYVHSFFDFEHAKGWFDFNTGKVSYSDKVVRSILDNQLIYNGSKYPLKSIIRAIKFVKRGWKIETIELLKMIFQLQKLDLTNPNILKDQLIGVYGENVSSFFDNLSDSGLEGNIFDDLLLTLSEELNKTDQVYIGSPSIIDFLNNY